MLCDKSRHAAASSRVKRRSERRMLGTNSTELKNRGEERRHRHPKTTLFLGAFRITQDPHDLEYLRSASLQTLSTKRDSGCSPRPAAETCCQTGRAPNRNSETSKSITVGIRTLNCHAERVTIGTLKLRRSAHQKRAVPQVRPHTPCGWRGVYSQADFEVKGFFDFRKFERQVFG